MPKGYRDYLPEQDVLLPPRLGDWLPENHLVYFVSDVVDQLDLSAMHAVYENEKRVQPEIPKMGILGQMPPEEMLPRLESPAHPLP